MNSEALCTAFAKAIAEFVEYRRTHGGIMLPDVVMVEGAFEEALYETGLRRRPKPPYEQVGSLLMPTGDDS
jgi:hypothetical protein